MGILAQATSVPFCRWPPPPRNSILEGVLKVSPMAHPHKVLFFGTLPPLSSAQLMSHLAVVGNSRTHSMSHLAVEGNFGTHSMSHLAVEGNSRTHSMSHLAVEGNFGTHSMSHLAVEGNSRTHSMSHLAVEGNFGTHSMSHLAVEGNSRTHYETFLGNPGPHLTPVNKLSRDHGHVVQARAWWSSSLLSSAVEELVPASSGRINPGMELVYQVCIESTWGGVLSSLRMAE